MKKGSGRLPFLPIMIVSFILLAPLILTGKAMFWGTPALQFVPWRAYAWDILTDGQLPLWNPLLGMGAPLLANYQSALLYPPNWILFLLDYVGGIGWAAWGQSILVWAHLAFAGLGMAAICRKIGLGLLAQTISGLAFGLSGYLVSRSGFLSINASVAWLPWIILLSTNIQNKPKIFHSDTLKISILFGLQFLAGHAQTAWYTILLAIYWSGVSSWIGETRKTQAQPGGKTRLIIVTRQLLSAWVRIIAGALLGFSIAAIQLIPTTEYLLQSQRSSSLAFEYASTYSFWPWRILTLITPGLFGSPVQGDYWGFGNYWEDALYIGLLPIVMAFVVIIRSLWKRVRKNLSPSTQVDDSYPYNLLTLFLLGLIVVSLLLALGNRTPIYPWLYDHIPTFSLFQAPSRFSIWAEFALALLAGVGIQTWRRPQDRALYWARLGTAGAFAISLGAGLAWYFLGGVSPTFIRATALAGFLGVCVGILTLLAPASPSTSSYSEANVSPSKWWGLAVMAVVSADLLLANWGLIPGIEQDFYREYTQNYERVYSQLGNRRIYMSGSDEYDLKFDRFFGFESFKHNEDWLNLRAVYLPNLTMLEGFRSANNFDPLVPNRFADWMEKLEELDNDLQSEKILSLLNLMGVGVVERKDLSEEIGVHFVHIADSKRVRIVPCARFVPDKETAIELVFDKKIDFEQEVVIEDANTIPAMQCMGAQSIGSVEIIAENASKLVMKSRSADAGWLVLSDVWFPGWQAKVDGVEVNINKANYLFRSIYVEAGTHIVEFSYRPASFWIGAGLTTTSITGLFLGWYFLLKQKHDPKST